MLLGIDVGGTFTDAVVLRQGEVVAQAKRATTHDDVLQCVLAALDAVLQPGMAQELERVVISSTIVTNALTEGSLPPAFLAIIAGPGMNVKGHLPVTPYYLSGYVDHRGKITANIEWSRHQELLRRKGSGVCAVSGKFSVRNPQLEYQAEHELKKCGYSKVFLGSELSGELNFVRRSNSAYFSAQVYELFNRFCRRIERALAERGISAPVHILKADGGTLPLEAALQQPVEAVFTGPAASVLGIEALCAPEVNSISLDVGEKEITALIGPSGCGKSTFLKTLNRMNDLVPNVRIEGDVRLRGEDIFSKEMQLTDLRRRVGMVFQKANPFPMSIYDNITYGPKLHGVRNKAELDELVESSLRGAALWDEVKDRLKKSALGLSGGQQQRLCIARALAVKPEVLLMDEPTSALDPGSTMKVEELMSELKKNYTVVIVTHNMQQAARISDRTAFFLLGELVEVGPTNQIFSTPRDKRTEDYISGRFG